MSEFNFGSKDTTYSEKTASVGKWLTPYTVTPVHLFDCVLQKSTQKNTPFIRVTFCNTEVTEGLINVETNNKQKTELQFYFTEKTVDSNTAADPKRFFGIIATNLGVRDEWEKLIAQRVTNLETYAKAIKLFFEKKPFLALIGAEEVLIEDKNSHEVSTWNKPYIWLFGTFCRPINNASQEELQGLLETLGEKKLTLKAKDSPDDLPSFNKGENSKSTATDVSADPTFDDDEW